LRIIERTIIPAIGTRQLAKLSPAHVHAMLRDLEQTGQGPSTRRVARVVLRRALALAQEWGLVQRNVVTLVKAPPATTKTDDALDLDGVKQLITAAEGDRVEALWVIAVTVGLRKGEALALTWDDVNRRRAEFSCAAHCAGCRASGSSSTNPRANVAPVPSRSLRSRSMLCVVRQA
jgi:integrase